MSCPITTHVLDTAKGVPASGITVVLEFLNDGSWTEFGRAKTNDDGRIADWGKAADAQFPKGEYRLRFDLRGYLGKDAFFPEALLHFQFRDARHHHVPLLLSPFGYSTYRGS